MQILKLKTKVFMFYKEKIKLMSYLEVKSIEIIYTAFRLLLLLPVTHLLANGDVPWGPLRSSCNHSPTLHPPFPTSEVTHLHCNCHGHKVKSFSKAAALICSTCSPGDPHRTSKALQLSNFSTPPVKPPCTKAPGHKTPKISQPLQGGPFALPCSIISSMWNDFSYLLIQQHQRSMQKGIQTLPFIGLTSL